MNDNQTHKLSSMQQRSLLIIFFTIVFTSCVIPTYLGKSKLKETEVKKSDVRLSHVLIVGAGSTASRLFLENLSTELTKLLAQNNIQSDFRYVGKIPRGSLLNLKEMTSSKYNGYLVLNPTDTSYTYTDKEVGYAATPLPAGYAGYGTISGNQYIEEFNLQFYTSSDSLTKVWQGELLVDFDFATSGRYQKIAEQIISKFIKHRIIISP